MNREYWIWLVMVFGAGNPKIWRVMEHMESPEQAYHDLQEDEELWDKFSLTAYQKRAVATVTLEKARQVLSRCEKLNIQLTCYGEGDYPTRLMEIYNPPCVLFYQGHLDILEEYPAVTVVGTRNPSPYSLQVADKICRELAKVGVVVVSGFALGIDSAAHRAALLENGRTVAVMGCGLDVDYPKGNASSKKYFVQKGLLLTEFLPGTEPNPRNFPLRNRILSGVSLGTLVIQAPERSGSLITASLALEQGKTVFCIPPADIFDKQYAGVVKYLRDGAVPVFSHLDIINEYYHSYAHKLFASVLFDAAHRTEESPLFAEPKKTEESSANRHTSRKKESVQTDETTDEPVRNDVPSAEKPVDSAPVQQTDEEQPDDDSEKHAVKSFSGVKGIALDILVLLSQEHQLHIDAITDRLGADEDEVASVLTMLAIDGYVKRLSGQYYGIL